MATAKVSPAASSELYPLRMATQLRASGETCQSAAASTTPNTTMTRGSALRQGYSPLSARYSTVAVNIRAKMVKLSQGAAYPLLNATTSKPVDAASAAPAIRVRA